MLSAIAARKAAQAARQDNSSPSEPLTPAASPPPVVESNAPPPAKPSSKRKPTSHLPRLTKKKKKEKPMSIRSQRYFTDSFKEQEDVIVIDSEDEDEDEDEDEVIFDDDQGDLPRKRGWSPSVPVIDSSDEDDDTLFALPPTQPTPPINKPGIPEILSTFQPILNQNTFILDSHAVSSFNLLPSDSGGTIIALQPKETICLLGTYTFCVIQGSVTVSGVSIGASSRRFPVFAPRSSPLPVLEGVDGQGAVEGLNNLPQNLLPMIGIPVALVLLQELRTGVEGMGHICRTFDGVFEPSSRWQNSGSTTSLLQIPGVHLVGARFPFR